MARRWWWCLPFVLSACGSEDKPASAVDSAVVDTAIVDTAIVDSTVPDTVDETPDASMPDVVDAADTIATDTFEPPEDAPPDAGFDTSYDGPTPTISIDDLSIAEGNAGERTLTFSLSLSAPMPFPVSVSWATADGTATAGTDYLAATGKVVFGPGIITVPLDLKILGDTTIEADETIFVDLTAPVGATIDKARGKATVLDDDTAGPSISITDVTLAEGDLGTKEVSFSVTLSAAATKAVTVSWSTVDGTARAAGTATGETDYAPGSGVLTFTPGETSKPVTITLRSDTLDELDETFDVELSGAINATIAKPRGTATITDDDPTPTVSINDVSLPEGASGSTKTFVFELTLSAASARPVTVEWSTSNGTALAPTDYLAGSGTVTFLPGDTKRTIGISVLGNNVVEPNETFNVTLATPVNATIADGTGVGTIVNDD